MRLQLIWLVTQMSRSYVMFLHVGRCSKWNCQQLAGFQDHYQIFQINIWRWHNSSSQFTFQNSLNNFGSKSDLYAWQPSHKNVVQITTIFTSLDVQAGCLWRSLGVRRGEESQTTAARDRWGQLSKGQIPTLSPTLLVPQACHWKQNSQPLCVMWGTLHPVMLQHHLVSFCVPES